MQQPLQEARQEGIALGEEKRAAAALMDVLDVRFQDSDVQILKPTFEASTDLQYLKQLLRTAAQAATINDRTRTQVHHNAISKSARTSKA